MAQLVTYSGKSLNAVLAGPLFGAIPFSGIGQQGVAQVNVRMTTDHANVQVGMDGAVVPSYVPGENGEIEVQVWQTSTIHQLFLAAYNAINAAATLGDVSPVFANTFFIQNINDGSSHSATGVAFKKVPDKTYDVQAGRISWTFVCCNITNQ